MRCSCERVNIVLWPRRSVIRRNGFYFGCLWVGYGKAADDIQRRNLGCGNGWRRRIDRTRQPRSGFLREPFAQINERLPEAMTIAVREIDHRGYKYGN